MSEITCTSATTFVNVSDDAEIRLVQVLVDSLVAATSTSSDSTTGTTTTTTTTPATTKIQQFNDACTKYITEGNIVMLLQTIVIDYNNNSIGTGISNSNSKSGTNTNNTTTIKVLDTLVRMNNTNEAVSCITILCALISKITSTGTSTSTSASASTSTSNKTGTAATTTLPITLQQQKTLTTALITSIVTSTAITSTSTNTITGSTNTTSIDTTIQQIATIERKIILLSILYNMSTKSNEKFTLLQTMYSLLIVPSSSDSTNKYNSQQQQQQQQQQYLISKILLHTDTTLGKLISIRRTTTGSSTTTNSIDDDDYYTNNNNNDTNAVTNTAVLVASNTSSGTTPTTTPGVAVTLSTTIQSTTTTSLKPPIVYLLDLWNVSIIERRTMYNTIILALSSSSSSSTSTSTSTSINLRKQQFLLLLVQTYSAATDSKGIDAIGQNAVKLVTIGTINDPVSLFYQQRTLLELYAVQSVLPKIDNGILYKLLHIVLYGTVSDYEQFLLSSTNVTQLLTKNYNFNIELIRNYMKVLSFCTVASSRMNSSGGSTTGGTSGNEIMYNDIKSIINVTTDDEIERWIIAAVNCGLVQTKMDQLRKVVIVEKSSYRTVVSLQLPVDTTNNSISNNVTNQQQEELISIRQQLQQWQSNVNTIVSSLTTTSLNGTNSNNTLPLQ